MKKIDVLEYRPPNHTNEDADYWINLEIQPYDALHRVDGPTTRYPDGRLEWYLHSQKYDSFDDWLDDNDYITDEIKIMLKLQYG